MIGALGTVGALLGPFRGMLAVLGGRRRGYNHLLRRFFGWLFVPG